MNISAVIFDLNGTLLDDEDEFGMAFNKILKKLGVDSNQKYPHESGIGVKENWKRFVQKYNIKTSKSVEQLAKETQEAYFEKLDSLQLREGAHDFIENLRDSGIQIGLGTSNTWENADLILKQIGLSIEDFDAVTTTEEVRFNKPDPDIFLTTSEKLGIDPEYCLVIEDSIAGVEAAHLAGMKAIAIARDEEYERKLKDADLVVVGFGEITPNAISEIK